jgi:co-chaperonin GroES (HSP10)
MKNPIATEGRLLIKVTEKKNEHKTSGGIVLARQENPDIHEGIVINVGVKKDKAQQDFTPGQIVYWQNYSGVEFDLEDKGKYIILNQSDVIAVESDEENNDSN